MPRPPKKPVEPTPPSESMKAVPPKPPLQPLQLIKKGTKPPEAPAEPAVTTPDVPEAKTSEGIKAPLRPSSLPNLYTPPASSGTTPSTRPRKPIPKAEIPVIENATSSSGEVFGVGDTVYITEPFGDRVKASIDSFYADAKGDIWARLKPIEVNPACRWEQGCLRGENLVKAS